tara:strand:+ start:66 stop:347 length:282 start_codon:yes stop_codon:yes gene_type:complete
MDTETKKTRRGTFATQEGCPEGYICVEELEGIKGYNEYECGTVCYINTKHIISIKPSDYNMYDLPYTFIETIGRNIIVYNSTDEVLNLFKKNI